MLKLSEFSHNHHLYGVKLLENFIQRGILVIIRIKGSLGLIRAKLRMA
jgi:hypothetical protein